MDRSLAGFFCFFFCFSQMFAMTLLSLSEVVDGVVAHEFPGQVNTILHIHLSALSRSQLLFLMPNLSPFNRVSFLFP